MIGEKFPHYQLSSIRSSFLTTHDNENPTTAINIPNDILLINERNVNHPPIAQMIVSITPISRTHPV